MPVATFDTLKFANTLKEAGVPGPQAEAQAIAFADVIQLNLKDLVTKDDLRQEIALVEQRLNAKIDTSVAKLMGEIYLLKWMFGATFTMVLAILWLVIRMSFAKLP
ncbi:MAG TPA: hypothetical protein VN641_07320 [Urbifossiella sp.]|nr:hypothetical protein [Urbifossiella sp.]